MFRSETAQFLWSLLKGSKLAFATIVLLSWASALLSVLSISLFVPLLALLFSSSEATLIVSRGSSYFSSAFLYMQDAFFAVKDHYSLLVALVVLCLAIFCAFVAKGSLAVLYTKKSVSLRLSLSSALRRDIFASVVNAPLHVIESYRKADLASAIVSDVGELERSLTGILERAIVSPILVAGYYMLLFHIDPVLSIMTLFLMPIYMVWSGKKTAKHSSNQSRTQKELTGLYHAIAETIANVKTVKLYNAQGQKEKEFAEKNSQFVAARRKVVVRRETAGPINEIGAVFVFCVCLVAFAFLLHVGIIVLSPLKFVAFVAIFSRIITPMQMVAIATVEMRSCTAVVARLLPLLRLPQEHIAPRQKNDGIAELSIVDGAYTYKRNAVPVFASLNCSFDKGTIYAIAGKSGAGKSTLLDCISGLRLLSKGSIVRDGSIASDSELLAMRNAVSYVGQKAEVFEGTLRSNISIGGSANNASDIEELLATVGLKGSRFVAMGADTKSQEDGKTFSGGEAQRLAIARAIAKPAPILILDEATSAVDPETELRIMEYLQRTKANRICIIVSHRLKTLQYADHILVLDHGQIAESGTYGQLDKDGSLFSQLLLLESPDR